MWSTYLHSIIQNEASASDLPPERLQEMRTICEALTLAGSGKTREFCDMMTQRLLSLEAKSMGRRELSRGLELIDTGHRGLASPAMLETANRALMREAKLAKSVAELKAKR